jgi:hypothetical protein
MRLFYPSVVFVRMPHCHAYMTFKAKCRPIVMKCRSIFRRESFSLRMHSARYTYSQRCLNGSKKYRKPIFSGKFLQSRGSKFKVPVLNVTCMQQKEFRSLAVLLYSYFTAFFTYPILIQWRKYCQKAIIRNTTEIACNSWTRNVHSLRFPRTPPLVPISCPPSPQYNNPSWAGSHYRGFTITFRPTSFGKLLWSSDRPDVEDSTWQHTTLTRDRHPRCRIDSNPQSQPVSGRSPTP